MDANRNISCLTFDTTELFDLDEFMHRFGDMQDKANFDIDPLGQEYPVNSDNNLLRSVDECENGADCAAAIADTTVAPTCSEASATYRPIRKLVPDNLKDERYWMLRKKNNEATRRCREIKKKKIEEIVKSGADVELELKCLKSKEKSLRKKYKSLKERTRALRKVIPKI